MLALAGFLMLRWRDEGARNLLSSEAAVAGEEKRDIRSAGRGCRGGPFTGCRRAHSVATFD